MKRLHGGIRAGGIRAGVVATTLAVGAALLASPTAQADGASAHAPTVRLTAAALAKLSARYAPQPDGVPGQVAAVTGGTGSGTPTGGAPAAAGTGSGSTAKAAANATAKSTAKVTAKSTAKSTAAGGYAFNQVGQWETAVGAAVTAPLGGTGDWVSIFGGGTVTRLDAKGDPVWDRTSGSLYTDWKVKPTVAYQTQEFTPTLYEGYNPYQPSATGTHPYAVGDFNHDGVDDVAVAYNVGVYPDRPFTSPGSTLDEGTFVTVLDGRDGHTLFSKLLPGYVGTMLVQDGKLIVADYTGPDWANDPVAEQGDSRSSLIAYAFTPTAGGKQLKAATAWTYSTQAPWAYWDDLISLGGGRIAAAWTDTPLGLGDPRPADGNVMVLDASDGRVDVDAKTPGYPRMLAKDPTGNRVLVVEQNDPEDAIWWSLSSIDASTGRRSVITTRQGTVPEAFQVVADPKTKGVHYAVAELGINADLTDGRSTVSGWDASGRTVWSYQTASTVGGTDTPVLGMALDQQGSGELLASVSDPVAVSSAEPDGPEHTQLIGFDLRTGQIDWKQDGALSSDQLTAYQGRFLTVGYDETAYSYDPRTGRSQAMPLLGDAYTATSADVNGDGVPDLIVAGQSRGVFALDGRTLKDAVPHVLWHATVSGPIHQVQIADLPGKGGRGSSPEIVAATSVGFAVIDPSTGKVRTDVNVGGGFVPSVTVTGDGHGGQQIIVPGATLSAYSANGDRLWAYRPSDADGNTLVYSNVVSDGGGHLVFEYSGVRSTPGAGPVSPAPTAVSLNDNGTPNWTEQPDNPSEAAWAVQRDGVYASPYIPGASGHGIAFEWGANLPYNDHLMQIVDARTGAVVTTHDTTGANTMQGLAASPSYGLIEMHNYDATVYPADGSAPYDELLPANPLAGAFVTAGDGRQTLVTATGGLIQWDQPLPDDGNYAPSGAQDFALDASGMTTAHLGQGKADDIVGLSMDWDALEMSLQSGGYDAYQSDSYQHGITVDTLTPATTASTGTGGAGTATTAATLPAQTAPAVYGTAADIAPATALRDPGLAQGTAANPLKVKASIPVVKPDTVRANGTTDDTEVTEGYTPQQIQARLGLTGDGAGQTVAIVDAYDYPTAEADLNHFSAHFDLAQTCDSATAGTDCFDFSQVYADGAAPAVDSGWNEEEALDIEWAHAIAPHAKIVLVEAADDSAAALYQAVDVAAALHPAAVSNSWGMTEFSEEGFYDDHCKLADSVCVQSTGDDGYPAGYSATNPYALAIGGTTMQLDADGRTLSETAWSSGGGGESYFEKRPAYQDGVQSSKYTGAPRTSASTPTRTPGSRCTPAPSTSRCGWRSAVPASPRRPGRRSSPTPTSCARRPASRTWPRPVRRAIPRTRTSTPWAACSTTSPRAPTGPAARSARQVPATTW